MIILITGCCGFIGGHLTEKCLQNNYSVIGIDNLNSFVYEKYNAQKTHTTQILEKYSNFKFIHNSIENVDNLVETYLPDVIVHLAAHANVRKSMHDKEKYFQNNVITANYLLEQISKLNKEKEIQEKFTSELLKKVEKLEGRE